MHRDIKPHNFFVSDSGTVKLGDFGIARGNRSASARSLVTTSQTPEHFLKAEPHRTSFFAARSRSTRSFYRRNSFPARAFFSSASCPASSAAASPRPTSTTTTANNSNKASPSPRRQYSSSSPVNFSNPFRRQSSLSSPTEGASPHGGSVDDEYGSRGAPLPETSKQPSNDMTANCGTARYMAPEVNSAHATTTYTIAADIFSLAMVFYFVWEQRLPQVLKSAPDEPYADALRRGARPHFRRTPKLIRDIVQIMWDPDPDRRAMAETILDTLDNLKAHRVTGDIVSRNHPENYEGPKQKRQSDRSFLRHVRLQRTSL